ncbi:MAG: HAD family phosphatase [Muribaculaceae bacterium]|nr:HAD family phosphatase [Muribaculaceae bacterium]
MVIRNLLFDLGGVVVDLRRARCVEAFRRLGLPEAESYFGEYAQSGIFMALEDGSASVDEFHAALRSAFPDPSAVSDSDIDDAFQLFIEGIPEHRLRALIELRKKYRIYLLSNTNPIMWDDVLAREFAKLPPRRREDYFDGMVTSFDARSAKPDAAIFRFAERTLGIRPEETLFFDDSQANVDAARALGFHALLVPPGAEFTDILHNFESAQ